jgi:RNA polymerase sigma-70 factor (ECF subfamily)
MWMDALASDSSMVNESSAVARPTHEERVRALMQAHFASVWRAVKRLGVADGATDDAAQRVFLVAVSKLDDIRAGGERAYLLGIAARVASDFRRAASRRPEVATGDVGTGDASSVPLADALLDEKRAREVLASVLDGLTPDLREAFVLFELEELTAPEVAAIVGVPEGTVASRVRRARAEIRASFERWRKLGETR